MTPPADRLSVRADLRLTVDGTDATVSGDGDRLVVTAEDPAALWDAVAGAVLPADVAGVGGVRSAGRAADALRAAGLRLEVRGPHGSVVQLGSGVRSGVGRVVAGSSAVSPGSARTVAPLVVHRVRQDPRSRAAIAVALAAVAVLLARRRARGFSRHSVEGHSAPKE